MISFQCCWGPIISKLYTCSNAEKGCLLYSYLYAAIPAVLNKNNLVKPFKKFEQKRRKIYFYFQVELSPYFLKYFTFFCDKLERFQTDIRFCLTMTTQSGVEPTTVDPLQSPSSINHEYQTRIKILARYDHSNLLQKKVLQHWTD